MIFHEMEVEGAFILEPERHSDERGWFARTFGAEELAARHLVTRVAQISASHNTSRGTLRGMHMQLAPHEETKVVRCTSGEVFDVLVDLRGSSNTFGRWTAAELSRTNGHAVYVPEGCAHGFLTLADESEVEYVISVPHAPDSAFGVRFDDPAFGIEWPFAPAVINERDRSYASVDLDALRSR
ncbi:MAG: dTDP-4-dehydrorhamnose 3,5-epimerase family protein [Acidimicrobiia bacterium]